MICYMHDDRSTADIKTTTDLSGDDAGSTCTAAQDEGELADLSQTGRDDPPNVSRARRQDDRQHQHGHDELEGREESGEEETEAAEKQM